uniref:Uncharacterized protein n=2 Tax=Kalmanozyma brasiliensis (strain GHG001) TaxID=1365824 RepID=V5EUL6_KALBG
MYAHALRARLQLASFKALNGLGKSSLSDLTSTASLVQPLAPSLVTNNQPTEQSQPSSSPASTPALSQGESLPSSSQSSTRSTRSIYMDIFGTDFRSTPSSSSSSSSKGLSRATSFASASTPSKRPSTSTPSNSDTNSNSTRSLLDKAASSPQLGSPERKNGHFDWHNNPTPAMVAHETKLAAGEPFALPTGSPSKRRREASHNAPSNNPLLNTPRRSRMQSSGGFLPNGHPASSLAQDLGLTAPRTPRSRHASGRHVFAVQPQPFGGEQDQAERDRVANTLAALAEARNASSGSDSSSSSDRPHTPPPSQHQAGLGIGFASPSVRRNSTFAQPHSSKRHKRNVSWSVLPAELHEEDSRKAADEEQAEAEEGEDRAAADYLLFLASSPSPSSIKRFSADTETVGTNGILSTPAQTSLWDPFNSSGVEHSSGRRSRMQSSAGGIHGLGLGPRHTNLSSSCTPLTPPPSARKHVRESVGEMVGLGFDAHTLSSATPSPSKAAANAEEYMLQRRSSGAGARSPRTPPSTYLSSRQFDSGSFMPSTPPNAPGAPGGDTTFHYADFVNVSPSPQPPSTGRFPGAASAYLGYAARGTPTKANRYRFDPRHA